MSSAAMGVEHRKNDLDPKSLVVEVFSELDERTIQERWRAINVLLKLSMLTGLEMQLEPTLNLLCDLCSEIVSFDSVIFYFWDEQQEQVTVRLARGVEEEERKTYLRGNVLNFWATKFSRPLIVARGQNQQTDRLLGDLGAENALVVPLFVRSRIVGSMQFYSGPSKQFDHEDAQLIWILSLVAENLLAREQTNEGLIRFAFTDYLTGLRTRGYFEQQLELEIKRAERKRQPFALLMVDIDFFKELNDTLGHHVGDQVLRDVASVLIKDMREVDTVSRYGGEEFVLILPETKAAGALFVAERLRRAVEQAKFYGGAPQSVKQLTISIGISIYGIDARYRNQMIEFADAALYEAKRRGRNQVVLYMDMMATRQRKEVS